MRKKVNHLPDDSLFIESGRIAVGDFLISGANVIDVFSWCASYYFLPDKTYALY